MFIINENEREYRFGDSGPKYLMKGPRSNFALVQFQPGRSFAAHYHDVMEESFLILEGSVDVAVNDVVYHLKQGDLLHVELEEVHYFMNNYDQPVKMISTLAPYMEVDKEELPDYKI